MHTHNRWEVTPDALRRHSLDRRYRRGPNWWLIGAVLLCAACWAVLGYIVWRLAG